VSAPAPFLLRRLVELGALSTEEAAGLLQTLGVLTLADLQGALDDGRVSRAGGKALHGRLRPAALAIASEIRQFTLGRARDMLDALGAAIAAVAPMVEALVPAGDVRRFEPLVSSLVLVGRAADPPAAIDAICGMPAAIPVFHRSDRRALITFQHAEVDVRIAAPDEYGTTLFAATGSSAHVAGIHRRRARPQFLAREEDVYAQAALPYIAPELRQGMGEIEAAAAGTLPALVRRPDIRGDLHMHTDYSDGADSVDAMVAACVALGYEYIAITDHSERAGASRTVSTADLSRQGEEIAAARERYPQITILHGIEADIMPDGTLDFPDRVLATLDIVLASLHDGARHDPETLTRRCIQAIRHPLVTVITHPANQLVGRRAGYPLDFDAVYAAAAETGTALEVDGAPSHLDLDGDHARAAVAAGVTLTIDSDCHRAGLLDRQMQLGIGTARRGWVEAPHVLNTRPLADVLAFIAAKRRRLG
jgi:DNA polymerase (family 10)